MTPSSIKKAFNYLKLHSVLSQLVLFFKKTHFKKDKISLFTFTKVFINRVLKDEILERANAVAFSFTMSIFPAVLFLFTLIPYVHNFIPSVDSKSIMEFIGSLMPSSMYDVIESTVQDIVSHSRGGLLTFGALAALFLATNGTMSLMVAFSSREKNIKKSGYVKKRLIAIGLTLIMALVLVLAILLLVGGQIGIDYLVEISYFDIDGYVIYLAKFLRLLVLFTVFFIATSSLLFFGSEVKKRLNFFSYGSLAATILTLSVSYIFSSYISNFGTYNKLYGSIGVMLALMFWIMLISIILLICYEINASIAHIIYSDKKIKKPK